MVIHFKNEGKKNLVAYLKAIYSWYKKNLLIVDENNEDDNEYTKLIDQSSDNLLKNEPLKKKPQALATIKLKQPAIHQAIVDNARGKNINFLQRLWYYNDKTCVNYDR